MENSITGQIIKEAEKTFFESLLKVQESLKTIVKDKKAFKGSYATIENVWESIRKIVNDNRFVVYHQSATKDGKLGMLTTAKHSSGESLDSFVDYSTNTDPQERGKEMTYYKRYNIGALFNVIIADEDNDANKTLGKYQKAEVSGKLAAEKLMGAKTTPESRKIYASLSPAERKTSEVIEAVKFLKDNEK